MSAARQEADQAEILRYQQAHASGIKTLLFVCTGNAIRSQIAEGIVNEAFAGRWAAFSAGTMPLELQKDVVKVMKEVGIDLTLKHAKHVDLFKDCVFDKVIVLCSDAGMRCPEFRHAREVEYMIFHDPLSPEFSEGAIWFSHRSMLRSLRDEIRKVVTAYLAGL